MEENSKEDRDIEKMNLQILVAEDTVFNQQFIKRLLNKRGIAVTIVNNGNEAVKTFMTYDFDLIFMDVKMPNLDGLEATRKIREIEKNSGNHTPIIAMTASSMEEDEQICKESGMDDFVSKPISSKKMFESIRSLVPPKLKKR